MGYRSVLLLLTAVSFAVGKPVDRHQIVQVPLFPTLKDNVKHQPAEYAEHSSVHEDFPHAPTALRLAASVEKDHDHNDVSLVTQSAKPLMKTIDEEQNKPAGKKGTKKGKKSNKDLLHHLGMVKLRSPAINHHRKRLASQSRKTHHQKSNSDSKMFVIKLPPNPYYYAHHDDNGYDVMEPQPSVNNLPVNFKTNGKPSRVYHWNIPVLKKMVARKAGSSAKSAVFADSDIFNIDKQATWNETDDDKMVYRKATFYGPKKPSKHAFRKYFAGNGKPHSFYVMEKSKKPASVYRLLP